MQSTETTFAGLELATQLISHHASIFLGVIILGMNKPRPWKCPWTSSKKRKKRTKNEKTAMNEQAKVGGKLKLRLSGIKPAKDRVESFNWQRRCNDSTCSFWLACLFLSNPIRRAFLQHISWRVSVESVINKRKSSAISTAFRMKEWLDCCMDVCSSYRIRQWYWTWKAFLSIKNYFYQHQNITIIIKGESETCPNFWNRHNNSLSKVYRFIWSCRVFVYYWTCFSRLAALVCFLAVVPFVIFLILLQQLQEKNEQPKISSSLRAQCETLRVDWRLRR